MKKFLVFALIASIASGTAVPVALGQKAYNDQWTANYVADSKHEEFKKLAGDAKCNICHIQGAPKKERNPYGKEAAAIFKEAGINKDSPKKDEAGFKKSIAEAFKKLEEVKAKDGKTFGEKIKAGELPGGNTEGK
jgi:hypothetical protein